MEVMEVVGDEALGFDRSGEVIPRLPLEEQGG
jgi:hypothetical protein